jgi:hypothetical protein
VISVLLRLAEPVPGLTADELFQKAREVGKASGSEPDFIVVGPKSALPPDALRDGRFACEPTWWFVDEALYGMPVLALRTAFQKCCGTATFAFDSVDQMTLDVYRRLMGATFLPVDSAGATFVRDGWKVRPTKPKRFGLCEYEGPLSFPFSIREEAKTRLGSVPATTRESIDGALCAWSIVLRSGGYWIAGVER